MDPGVSASQLASIPLFRDVSPDTLGRLADIATAAETVAGQVLTQPGTPGSGLFVVEEGTVVVERPGRADVELGPGECFGELALLTAEGVRTARVRARSAGRCLAISRDAFVDLLHREPSVAVALLSVLAGRMADTLG